jgi:hypothetical protein
MLIIKFPYRKMQNQDKIIYFILEIDSDRR